ncbi:hypothetical protein TorRG33x02_331300 [Trema orientale]|uniref:Uncharacterized protein n=1 Tax=Trema orientale TaxID=63057 RepID=A0A2P5B648_TREOI|nr:hypothetical protein TorRG33x02_331300 [Trema orientale]
MTPEIPSNAEKEAFASEFNTIKTTIKDYESYMKSLNEEILIDDGRAAERGVLWDLAIVKEQWYQKYGFPGGWKLWDQL